MNNPRSDSPACRDTLHRHRDGLRVPGIVISPYAKSGFIADQGSLGTTTAKIHVDLIRLTVCRKGQ
jgi:hypothetical protein